MTLSIKIVFNVNQKNLNQQEFKFLHLHNIVDSVAFSFQCQLYY